MKKQALAMLLGTALVFGTLAGCGGSEESKELQRTRQRVKIHRMPRKRTSQKKVRRKAS